MSNAGKLHNLQRLCSDIANRIPEARVPSAAEFRQIHELVLTLYARPDIRVVSGNVIPLRK